MLNYFLKKLDSIQDGDATLLDRTAVLYGSGMSDGNVHNNLKVPVMVVGGKSLGIRGNRHVRYPERHAAVEPDAGSDGSVRRPTGEVRRQHCGDRSDDDLVASVPAQVPWSSGGSKVGASTFMAWSRPRLTGSLQVFRHDPAI